MSLRRIRSLKPGEALPPGEPRRYPSIHGYIRLRWKLGPGEYVETYEHRVTDGRVTTAEQVHHRNGVRDDNRPENLVTTTARAHLRHHADEWRRWDLAEARRLYEAGQTTTELATRYGTSADRISRGLRAAGVEMRRPNDSRLSPINAEVLTLHFGFGLRSDAIAKRLGVSRMVVRRVMRVNGLVFPPGRPGRREAS